MYKFVISFDDVDVMIAAAAVADYKPKIVANKIKKADNFVLN
jgi:phosphopantothenoylcysteine synthetase/decarboxylase